MIVCTGVAHQPLLALELTKCHTMITMFFSKHEPLLVVDYDRLFRQAAAQDPAIRWDSIEEDIYVWALTQCHNFRDRSTFPSRIPYDNLAAKTPTDRATHTQDGDRPCTPRLATGHAHPGWRPGYAHPGWRLATHTQAGDLATHTQAGDRPRTPRLAKKFAKGSMPTSAPEVRNASSLMSAGSQDARASILAKVAPKKDELQRALPLMHSHLERELHDSKHKGF